MADPTKQYNMDLKLPQVPLIPKTNEYWEDFNNCYNAIQQLALAIETINARLTAAGIP